MEKNEEKQDIITHCFETLFNNQYKGESRCIELGFTLKFKASELPFYLNLN